MKNIYPVKSLISESERKKKYNHNGHVIWLFGLSGSGKSTLALEIEKDMFERGLRVVHLDGDCLRSTVNKDLGFSDEDRRENIRRAMEFAKLLVHQGIVVIASFITPQVSYRSMLKSELGESLSLFYISASIEICQKRDPKGLYEANKLGNVSQMTGIASQFEYPENEDGVISIVTENFTLIESFNTISKIIYEKIK